MPELKRLNQIAGENVHLAVMQGNDLVVLAELGRHGWFVS